jgi:hypothetical protein
VVDDGVRGDNVRIRRRRSFSFLLSFRVLLHWFVLIFSFPFWLWIMMASMMWLWFNGVDGCCCTVVLKEEEGGLWLCKILCVSSLFSSSSDFFLCYL